MAYKLLITYLTLFSLISSFCHCFNPKRLNVSKPDDYSGSDWISTQATFYGSPDGFGSEGGACGYEKAVESAPFSSKITAIAPSLYNSGKGCGLCYQVKCTSAHCSGQAVTVVATDSCPGCSSADHLFDLSGTSFGAMATPGQENDLRNVGNLQIQYKSIECDYPGVNVAFRIDPGSNDNYFATAIEYEDGSGIVTVALRQANTAGDWLEMDNSWGAVWKINLPTLAYGKAYTPPFSIKLTDDSKTVVAEGVIPAGYAKDQTYKSLVNFDG